MTPLFITSFARFVHKTAKWWIGTAILTVILGLIAFIVWLIIAGAGMAVIVGVLVTVCLMAIVGSLL